MTISFCSLDKSEREYLTSRGVSASESADAYCLYAGFLTERFYDEERGYCFGYPRKFEDGGDISELIDGIAAYAVKEEIPLAFCGVPREELSTLCRFSHITADAEDSEQKSYRVRIESELSLARDIPRATVGSVTLTAMRRSDKKKYYELCTDEERNEFWGYDYREDEPNPSVSYFYDVAERERAFGTALSLAIRCGGKFIGEASLYAFDLRAGAEVSFRLFKNKWGHGLGRMTLEALFEIAEALSLNRLYATVDRRNTRSVRLLSDYMDKEREENGLLHFVMKAE